MIAVLQLFFEMTLLLLAALYLGRVVMEQFRHQVNEGVLSQLGDSFFHYGLPKRSLIDQRVVRRA